MIRLLAIFGMTGGFLVISPSLRLSVLNTLGRGMFFMDQHSPYSFIGLAIMVGTGAVLSMSTPRPQ